RDLPTPRDAAAAVDSALRSGGLLMSLADRPAAERSPAWLARLETRRDRWRDARPPLPLGRLAKTLAVPAVFALLAWTAPVESMSGQETAVDRTVAGDRLTGELAETLAALADSATADPAALARAKADLQRLTVEIGEDGPTGSQLEAADALRERMLGAVAAAGTWDGETAAGLAGTLASGADLLAGSGLLESEAVRNAATAAGLDDPERLRALLSAAGENPDAILDLAAGLTEEQRTALAAAGAEALARQDPEELLASLPPELAEALASPRAAESSPAPRPGGPEPRLPPFDLPLPNGAAEAGSIAAQALAPGLASAGRLAEGLWSARPAAPVRSAPPNSPQVERPPASSRRLTAGRPVPPRLRGVVRRYFSAQTPPPVAE
ncbi:hypothetical protein, partial [Alienimonas sp. DA493]|uniref:hypothetical protein n=1 Tax=Alienimonas sp. DA493 TaxID=3373605 RepID=UPI003754E1C7